MPFDLSTAAPMQQQAMPQSLTGEDYLKTLPPATASLVKKYANGELAVTPQMTRTSQGAQLLGAISQYDPTFDATNYQKRQQTASAFAKGPQGNAVRGANQALYHMGNLYQRAEDLGNTGILPGIVNPIVNYVQEKGFGDSRQAKFRQSAQAVASELRRVFAGAGGGSLAELNEWKETMPVNASEEQQKAYIQNGLDLLKGGIDALNQQYQAGMGLNKNVTDLLNPQSRKVYEKLQAGENPNPPKVKTKGQKQGDILSQPAKITNDDEYNKLPAGATFVGPDGVTRTKPRG
jgi:hypothetical protein